MRIFKSWPVVVVLLGCTSLLALYSLSVIAHPHNHSDPHIHHHVDTPQDEQVFVTFSSETSSPLPVACEIGECDVAGCEDSQCSNQSEVNVREWQIVETPCEEAHDSVVDLAIENAHLSSAVVALEQRNEYAELLMEIAVDRSKAKMQLKAARKLQKQVAEVQRERDELRSQLTLLMQERRLLAESLARQIRVQQLVAKLPANSDSAQQETLNALLAESTSGLQAVQQQLAHGVLNSPFAQTAVLPPPTVLPSTRHLPPVSVPPCTPLPAVPPQQFTSPHGSRKHSAMITVTPRIVIQEEEEELLLPHKVTPTKATPEITITPHFIILPEGPEQFFVPQAAETQTETSAPKDGKKTSSTTSESPKKPSTAKDEPIDVGVEIQVDTEAN